MDRWKSGTTVAGRDGFELMIHLSRKKPRDAELLILNAYSRFGRDPDDAQFYRAELRMNGWLIHSMTDQIPPGRFSRLFEALVDWKNEQFIIDLRSSTLRGLLYIAERGCLPNGEICPGYTTSPVNIGLKKDGTQRVGRKPVIDPQSGPLVIRAFELKASGAPHQVISQETGLYKGSNGAWNNLFRNRAYVGEYEFRGQLFTDIYPALISRELFDAVQARIPPKKEQKLAGRHHPRRRVSKYFLANVAVCAYCDGPMEGKSVHGYRYYVCCAHNERTSGCPEASLIPADDLEEEVLRVLLDHILKGDYLQDLLNWTNGLLNSGLTETELRLEGVRQSLNNAEQVCRKLALNFGLMEMPSKVAEQLLHEQESEVEQLREEMIELQRELENSRVEATEAQIADYIGSSRELIDGGEFFDLRELVEQLCARIVLSAEECHLVIRFPLDNPSAVQNANAQVFASSISG